MKVPKNERKQTNKKRISKIFGEEETSHFQIIIGANYLKEIGINNIAQSQFFKYSKKKNDLGRGGNWGDRLLLLKLFHLKNALRLTWRMLATEEGLLKNEKKERRT